MRIWKIRLINNVKERKCYVYRIECTSPAIASSLIVKGKYCFIHASLSSIVWSTTNTPTFYTSLWCLCVCGCTCTTLWTCIGLSTTPSPTCRVSCGFRESGTIVLYNTKCTDCIYWEEGKCWRSKPTLFPETDSKTGSKLIRPGLSPKTRNTSIIEIMPISSNTKDSWNMNSPFN